ncbi:hypothetical protein AC626_23840 [Pseudoalteromonas rubra]|uniref:Uncharacterized protein n=1 Tax=Pseudoalteromonas rubra TaxID=43658 RepID=A0A0L0ELI2_9GAMM|nr:hypothetical protein AC626_23840 [Pseudoalteromonas rubra]
MAEENNTLKVHLAEGQKHQQIAALSITTSGRTRFTQRKKHTSLLRYALRWTIVSHHESCSCILIS